ncbi:MAG: HAMP domain-containing histidine kinase [Candidatus Wallbacteria bacterium]|nr:HAMP domain-containing histidine kinase [Candidatus Wallbacteria bacterium]
MSRVSLRTRLLVGVLIPLLAFGLILHTALRRVLAAQVSLAARTRAGALGQAYAAAAAEPVLLGDQAALDRVTSEMVSSRAEISYAFVADPAGAILSHSFAGGFPEQLLPIAATSGEQAVELCTELGRVCHATVPLLDGTPGSVHVALSERDQLAQSRALVFRLDLMFALLGSLVCGLVFVMQTLAVSRLRELARGISRSAPLPEKDEAPLSQEGPREVANIASAFNAMRLRLAQTHDLALESERFATVGRLAAGLVHELNNPLSGVDSFLRRLDSGKLTADALPVYSAMAREAMDRVFSVLRRVVDGAGPGCVTPAATDVCELAREAIENAGQRARARDVRLILEPSSDLVPAIICRDLVRQAVENLLVNAVEASEPGGDVRLALTLEGSELVLEVRDRGCGMPPELAARIGEPFFTTKGSGSGLGLGLFLVRGALRHCGGTMQVRSEPGAGTLVKLRIPVAGGAD